MKKTLPPEWATQRFVQLTWPHTGTDWADMLNEVTGCFIHIAQIIIRFEPLLIVCHSKQQVINLLGNTDISNIIFAELPSNDTWARDHGGIMVLENDNPVVYDFAFNGWGEKFQAHLDNQITKGLFDKQIFGNQVSYRNCLDFILEGGSIDTDGQGTLLTTSTCLLSKNRNELTKNELESRLKDYFGVHTILWLNHGYLEGDDTDSHIDTLARFCSHDTIAYVHCNDRTDSHFGALNKMEAELQQFKQSNGKVYNLIALPMADPVFHNGERLPATYANFLIINQAVLVPTYESPRDKIALKQLKKAFPEREIIGINCLPLIKQHGSLHCVTMQYI